MLAIHPEECIDCTLCVPGCPIDAIFDEENLPDELVKVTVINAEYVPQWPVIDHKGTTPPDASEWEDVQDKRPEHFDAKPAARANDE
jgi:ferredoxin